MMPVCCLESFVVDALRTGFRLAKEGDEHTCDTCGRVYALVNGQWRCHDYQEEQNDA